MDAGNGFDLLRRNSSIFGPRWQGTCVTAPHDDGDGFRLLPPGLHAAHRGASGVARAPPDLDLHAAGAGDFGRTSAVRGTPPAQLVEQHGEPPNTPESVLARGRLAGRRGRPTG